MLREQKEQKMGKKKTVLGREKKFMKRQHESAPRIYCTPQWARWSTKKPVDLNHPREAREQRSFRSHTRTWF